MLHLHLIDTSPDVVDAWRDAFDGGAHVTPWQGDILPEARDTIVAPANSYGCMDGGIDRV